MTFEYILLKLTSIFFNYYYYYYYLYAINVEKIFNWLEREWIE